MAKAPYVAVHVKSSEPGRRVGAREIADSIACEIMDGRLPAGARLPPVRALEHQLGSSKNTVQAAYEELVARGLIVARARDGVYVTHADDDVAPRDPLREASAARWAEPLLVSEDRRGMFELGSVFIDPELLPRERLAECFRAAMRDGGPMPFYDPQGYAPLRVAIAERLRGRGIAAEADDVVVTVGSQQALDIVARAIASRAIAIEDPGYRYVVPLLRSLGHTVTGLPLDPFAGLDLQRWGSLLVDAQPGLVYATTSFHNPTGYSYTSSELVALLELSAAQGFALMEDDWGSDMLSGSEYRPTLRALGGPRVLYVNSFTKKLLPSLRIGFVLADSAAVPALVAAKRTSVLGGNLLAEQALFEFLDRGYYDTHLAQLQRALDERYQACLAALRETMPSTARWTTPGGGPTLWLDLPRGTDLVRLRARMAARGIHIEPGETNFIGTPHLCGFRIGYARHPPAALARAIAALAEEIGALT
jgi:GntR family transcriptional regulator/MocR family aminotransferase